jgi:hypothetical protein
MFDPLFATVPQVGAGAHASIAVVGWHENLLSKFTPPLHDVPVLQPYIHAGSNVTGPLAKFTAPPGHICAGR